MASLDVGECKCDKGTISISALHKNWGAGEDGSQNVAGLSIEGVDGMIILTSYQVKDLIDKLQTANQWVRDHYLDSWSYDELKEAKVLFNPPLEWEQDEKEAIRQKILAEEKAKREKLATEEEGLEYIRSQKHPTAGMTLYKLEYGFTEAGKEDDDEAES